MDVKRCSKCGETKPIEMFSNDRKSFYCDVCQSPYNAPISKRLAKVLAHFEAIQQVLNTGIKLCRKCGQTKPVNMFGGNGREKDGFHKYCKACMSAKHQTKGLAHYKQQSRGNNGKQQLHFELPSTFDEVTQQILDYRCELSQEYLKVILENQAARHARELQIIANREARQALDIPALYRLMTPKIRKSSTVEEIREYRKYLYQLRKARIEANGGSHTRAEIRALLEAQNHQCAYCKRRVKLTEDHIIPLRQGGRDDIANICMACGRCNRQKNGRTPAQWIKRWYLLEPYNPDAP